MGSRYIELFVSSKGDMLQAVQLHGYYADQPDSALRGAAMQLLQPSSDSAQPPAPYSRSQSDVREGSDTLRLRGLPYSAGVDEITDFFSGEVLYTLLVRPCMHVHSLRMMALPVLHLKVLCMPALPERRLSRE